MIYQGCLNVNPMNKQSIIMEVVILNVFISRFLSYVSAIRISLKLLLEKVSFGSLVGQDGLYQFPDLLHDSFVFCDKFPSFLFFNFFVCDKFSILKSLPIVHNIFSVGHLQSTTIKYFLVTIKVKMNCLLCGKLEHDIL